VLAELDQLILSLDQNCTDWSRTDSIVAALDIHHLASMLHDQKVNFNYACNFVAFDFM